MIRDSWIRLKNLLREYSVESGAGYRAKRLFRDIGLAIPLDALAEALKIKGYKASSDSEAIYTTAPYDEVVTVATLIKEALESLKEIRASRTAKRLIVSAYAVTGLSVYDIITRGIELGLLEEDPEGKILIKKDWREALRDLVKVIEGERGA